MPLEHGLYPGHIENAISPAIELFQGSHIEALAGCFVEGAEAFDKKAFQALDLPFQPALLQTLLHPSLNSQSFNAGDVGHFGFSFDDFDILPKPLFERIGQTHHPVDDGKEIQDALTVPALPVERTHEAELGLIPGLRVAFGLTGAQMRDGNEGEGVGVRFE